MIHIMKSIARKKNEKNENQKTSLRMAFKNIDMWNPNQLDGHKKIIIKSDFFVAMKMKRSPAAMLVRFFLPHQVLHAKPQWRGRRGDL